MIISPQIILLELKKTDQQQSNQPCILKSTILTETNYVTYDKTVSGFSIFENYYNKIMLILVQILLDCPNQHFKKFFTYERIQKNIIQD